MGRSISQSMRRIRQILSFAGTGRRPWNAWQLAVLGFSRGHQLSSPDLLSRWLYRWYPSLLVRPAALRGATLELDGGDFTHAATYEEIFLEITYDLSLISFQPQAVIDCGAHIGTFTLLAATSYPDAKLISFEPNPKNAAMLRRQVDRNHLKVEVIEAAVSVADGQAWFAAEYSCGGAIQPSKDAASSTYQVRTVDFPAFVRNMAVSSLLLKMDIEGEERRLMPELLPHLPRVCGIFIETHHGSESWQSTAGILSAAGFTTGMVRDRGQYIDAWAIRR
jgi:FkbM family methyltransferase